MGFLTIGTWIRFLGWMAIGIVFYFLYSRSHSRLGRTETPAAVPPRRPDPAGEGITARSVGPR